MSEIKEIFEAYWSMQRQYSIDSALDQLSWDDFVRIVSTMNIKTRGVKIEKRIIDLNSWQKMRGRSALADAVTPEGKTIEIKSSIISPLEGSSVTFRGIRPWIEIDETIFVLIDINDPRMPPLTEVFSLTQMQIRHEVGLGSFKPYSMKKEDREPGDKRELGTSFKAGDLDRWRSKYKMNRLILEAGHLARAV